jgi:hypothetical protein
VSTPIIEGKASFALRGHNPDVLTCIANLSNDEVFTPPELANQMLDTLQDAWAESNGGATIWASSTVTFLDPFTKSGVFLRQIVSRLTAGLADQIPDLAERVDHILTKQVYGIGITRLTSLLARRSVYCSKDATGEHSIAKSFDRDWGNIWFDRTEHTWAGNKCGYCGANKAEYSRSEDLETHAYAFIHTTDIKARLSRMFGAHVQFDVIIGNPPYQLSSGDTSDAPIYHRFVEQAMKLEPRFLSMITPSRWFTGGKGLDAYRAAMIQNRHLRVIVDFPDSKDTFPGVEIKGGVSYFLWDRDQGGDCQFDTRAKGASVSTTFRDLRDGMGVVVRDNRASSIIKKVTAERGARLSSRVSPQTPFGLYTNFADWQKDPAPGYIRLFKRGLDEAWVDPRHVSARRDWIPKVKVIMSYAYNGGDALPHQVIGKPIVVPGNSVCTQTYMVAGIFDSEDEAANYALYLRTRLVRFLIRQRKISQHNRPDTFEFVPDLPLDRIWTDEDLYVKYQITPDEQSYIEQQVRAPSAPVQEDDGADD